MQKWCPEPLDSDAVLNVSKTPNFARDESVATENPQAVFEPDPGFGSGNSLWDLMSEVERAELMERAHESLRPEYEKLENESREVLAREREELRAAYDARFDIWTREFEVGQIHEREALASDAAGLALALARKIIRDTVQVDPGVLIRTLETALFKIKDSRPLTVVLNPEDALILDMDPDLKSRLRVGEVVPDRRIERGGCRVRAGGREWDATITRQLDVLAAVVEEAVEHWESQNVEPNDIDHTGLGDSDETLLG